MAQLIVRRIEDEIVKRLRRQAAAEGISVEDALRRLLRRALTGKPLDARKNFSEHLRAMPTGFKSERLKNKPRDIEI